MLMEGARDQHNLGTSQLFVSNDYRLIVFVAFAPSEISLVLILWIGTFKV